MKNRRKKMEKNQVTNEMDNVIKALEEKGLTKDSFKSKEMIEEGLGDVVESVLISFGITEDRFKQWFGLKECNCSKRKKWLNGLFSWKRVNHSKKDKDEDN